MESDNMFRCPRKLCKFFSQNLFVLVTHLGAAHGGEQDFSVTCHVGGCPQKFTKASSYRRHLYRSHRSVVTCQEGANEETSRKDQVDNAPESDEHVNEDDTSEEVSESGSSSTGTAPTFSDLLDSMKKNLCLLSFNLTEEHKVAHTVADALFEDIEFLVAHLMEQFVKLIRYALRSSEGRLPSDMEALLDTSFVSRIFKSVKTSYQREQFARKTFPFVEPQQVEIGKTGDTFQYVPVGSVIQNVLQLEDAKEMLVAPHTSSQTHCRDFRDGILYKSLVPDCTVETVCIIIYTDELEIANPLGPKRGVHKLTVIYFSLLNMHPRYRSKLKYIYLAVLAKYAHVVKYGLAAIWNPLLEELSQLHSVGLALNGRPQPVKVVVLAVCGDNLSQHKLAGFSCNFSKGRVCRFCMADSTKLHEITREELCQVRTKAVHSAHLTAVRINPDNCKLYGVTGPSPLATLAYFDVTSQMAPDIMHDLFEGVFALVIRHVMKGLINDKVLARSDLERVRNFAYGYNDKKNRPEELNISFLTGSSNLKGTASQRWCLFRLLPLIFCSSVPEGNQDWEVLLKLEHVVDIVLAEEMPQDVVGYLEVAVESFIQSFCARYPEVHPIPKMHYLVHYARMSEGLGPLRQYWCLRFESKHQYFKNMAVRVKNFRNICGTLASRHQLLQGYQMSSHREGPRMVHVAAVNEQDLPSCAQILAQEGTVLKAGSISFDSYSYKLQDVLVMQKAEVPTFAQVAGIYVTPKRVSLLLELLRVQEFCAHAHAFKVARTAQFKLSDPGKEASWQRLDIYHGTYVAPRCEIIF